MGFGDLTYQLEAGAVGGEAVGADFRPFADAGSGSGCIAFNIEHATAALWRSADAQAAARRIMAHAVGE